MVTRKTESEVGGLCEERFGGNGRGEKDQGIVGGETGGGDGSEMGSVTDEGKQKSTMASGIKRGATI